MKKKSDKKVFKLREFLNVIDENGRIWVVIRHNTLGVLLSAMEEEPLPNAIVVSANTFYEKFKEYEIPIKPRKKGNISWEDKKGKGSYFDPKLVRRVLRPYTDNKVRPSKPVKKITLSDDDINFSDFSYNPRP